MSEQNFENFETNNGMDVRHLHDHCHRYMNHHVLLRRTDGVTIDGIIVNVDIDHVTVLIGEDVMDREEPNTVDYRQYGAYGGYDDDDNGYGRPRRRRYRRYRPHVLPLAALAGLSLFPYTYPGYYPYPPYYPYQPYPYY